MNLGLLKAELILDEGLRLKPYLCPAGKLTIGVGRNLTDRGISYAEAMVLFDNDIAIVVDGLDHALPWWQALPGGPDRALANMGRQYGGPSSAGLSPDAGGALRRGDYATASREAQNSQWATQVGPRAERVGLKLLNLGGGESA